MTPEALSRGFSGLGRYGVEVRGREIRLTDAARLSALGKLGALIDSG
jgi:hypothetical protein